MLIPLSPLPSISCPSPTLSSMSLLLSAAASLEGTRPSIIPILVIFFARILLISHMDLINQVERDSSFDSQSTSSSSQSMEAMEEVTLPSTNIQKKEETKERSKIKG